MKAVLLLRVLARFVARGYMSYLRCELANTLRQLTHVVIKEPTDFKEDPVKSVPAIHN